MTKTVQVLDHGSVTLRNIAGPIPRRDMDFDADDTDPANAARFSFNAADEPDRAREDDLKLANYLLKNRHTTPFEMIEVWLEMEMPIFVARQFVRHRTVSINEVSARYVQLPNKFYIPNPMDVGAKSKSNKQGRDIVEANAEALLSAETYCGCLRAHCDEAYKFYETAIADGIPNELARMALPLNVYTKWLWNQDLHNLMHLMSLRLHGHAQFEARAYAQAIYDLISGVLPETMKLFDEHIRKNA